MKKILIFSLVYYPRYIGGAEVAVKEITDRISPSEVEFDMVTLRKHAPAFEKIGNVNVYRVGFPWISKKTGSSKIFPLSKYLFIFFALVKALSLHRKNKYDATWSIMANYAGFSALFFKVLKPKVPFILTLQEGDPFAHIKKRVGILLPVFKAIFKKADYIQAISKYLAEWAKDMGAKCPIEVVPNGVDLNLFSNTFSEEEKRNIRDEVGFREEDKILVTASRLVKKNATEDIIMSLKHLDESYRLLVLGTGSDRSMLDELVQKENLSTRVYFKGFVEHKDLPRYLSACDIFIRPSRSEGLGNSFLEAMAVGLPVIATKVGGIPDFLVDGETGLFCEVDNPANIAQKVIKLTRDHEARDYIVKKAKQMVHDKYSWDQISGQMKTIFANVSK